MKRLIVNADDFGFTRDVNAGIIEAHTRGIVTAATLMANGDAFDDAVQLAHANPSLDVGAHFVLIGGHSLLTQEPLPKDAPSLARAVYAGQLDLYGELAAQANKIKAAGISPSHADTHKHTHLLPPVFRALCIVAEEFQIPFLRRPADLDLPFRGRGSALLGDGSESEFDIHEATIAWAGERRLAAIDVAETEPLLGVGLLLGNELTVQVVAGGTVALQKLRLA